ncbi:MAG: hypothetical protein EOP86_17190 [Verrucomicrobiaceae bacterium]|nr:MAG: hypothetical protein EOP86_17190 [Verrucomicrobiaceae bacterium]
MRTLLLMIPALMAAGTLFLTGCDSRPAAAPPSTRMEESSPSQGQPQSAKAKQADFLNRIRAADPQGRTIDRALLNEQNELGLVLDRSVELDKIPALMKVMLTKMAAEFPGEDLTILTYTPSSPPRKIGTARLNARTRDMTYTAEQ